MKRNLRIAVITPYFETPDEWLMTCNESVKAQTLNCRHILVCDGSTPCKQKLRGDQINLPRNYADYGNTPRIIGTNYAMSLGAEVIAYLDADNWYQPEHIELLLTYSLENNADLVCSSRQLHRLDGSYLGPCPFVNDKGLVDTNCLLLRGKGLLAATYWGLRPQENAALCDQFIWQLAINNGLSVAFSKDRTVAYRTRHAVHYELANEEPPPNAIRRYDLSGKNFK